MKIAKIALVITMGLAGISTANAANQGQGTGTVTFHGSIIDAPCSISADTTDQTVELGAVGSATLENAGTSIPVPFSIDLQNCEADAGTVQVTFNGVADATNPELLGLNGTAAGAGIAITDGSGAALKLGTPSSAQTLTQGDNTLQFAAYLQGASGSTTTITPGEFNSIANFSLTYA
ncbi:type 1 fimbrial protein [Buttiauxella sp. B2]|uniref:fimbrial protein n=1 Tax=Buttiauxella sp. B2 TaxID=2587812 RepID=UPI00111DED31|nr:fimbrial protein [Buttiauxella sp. B2]TNV10773.1 type 1 fimbrial protein [Buttiauxella sp. B2]